MIYMYAAGLYVLLGVVIGVDNHMANQDLAPGVPRPSAALRGVFWLPYAIVGLLQAAWDGAQHRSR